MLQSYFHPILTEAGLDEAGRGCLAGPVVAGAVILPKDYRHALLNDSKQLSRRQREQLRAEIEREAIAWAVAEASHQEVDEINVLQASLLAMHRAVNGLKEKQGGVLPEHLLVDGNCFKSYPLVPHTCVVRGDSLYLPIAAASILAKTYRDMRMETLAKLFPQYGWERNAGYATVQHQEALRQVGPCEHHRKTFRLIY